MFPEEDVRLDLLPDEAVTRHEGVLIELEFHYPDEWLEEDEELIGHARDPFKRIDCRRTSRHIRVSIGGQAVADTRRAVALFETNLPTRWYLPKEDLVAGYEPTTRSTRCPYKGSASYWSVGGNDDIAWSYEDPIGAAAALRGLVAFYDEVVDVDLDGERQERGYSPFAKVGSNA